MTDHIIVRRLRVPTRVGATNEERVAPQQVLVTLEIACDTTRAGKSDDLADTIDYDRLVSQVAEQVRASETNLLEALAHKVAAYISTIAGVHGVTVEIAKESPPVAEELGEVAIRIER